MFAELSPKALTYYVVFVSAFFLVGNGFVVIRVSCRLSFLKIVLS